VIVNRSFVTELLGGGAPIGRRVRYLSLGKEVQPWLTIAGVVDDFPSTLRNPDGTSTRSARIYHLAMPGESSGSLLTIRLRGQTPKEFTPTLRRIAASVDPMLEVTKISALDVMFSDYAKGGAQLALVVALVTGSVILLSAAGIHALMSFAVNQRRREIGIRTALRAE
jgi:putative ABC transport system permease protein